MLCVRPNRWRKILSNQKTERIHLTPTGLLMKGVYTQPHTPALDSCRGDFECGWDFTSAESALQQRRRVHQELSLLFVSGHLLCKECALGKDAFFGPQGSETSSAMQG